MGTRLVPAPAVRSPAVGISRRRHCHGGAYTIIYILYNNIVCTRCAAAAREIFFLGDGLGSGAGTGAPPVRQSRAGAQIDIERRAHSSGRYVPSAAGRDTRARRPAGRPSAFLPAAATAATTTTAATRRRAAARTFRAYTPPHYNNNHF